MKRFWYVICCISVLFAACKEQQITLEDGLWWGKMDVSSTEILPFNFEVSNNADGTILMEVFNANEVVVIDEIKTDGDSIHIQMPVFEGYISGVFTANEIVGSFVKEDLERVVPFSASSGDKGRFQTNAGPKTNVSGIWEVYFDADTPKAYPAKGIFVQEDGRVTGTFRTETGDYRYLDGVVNGDTLKLSTFDGSHAFLFTALATDSTLSGHFYSGNHYKVKFEAKRNEAFELPNANELTFLKEGFDRMDFTFPDAKGNMISLSDDQFKDKAVLVQIMGTWCPNCLDETKFYVDYLKSNPDTEVAFVALAFEYSKTEERAWEGVARLKKRVGVEYPILLAQYGTSNKTLANEKLPMLNHVLSYPTTIYVTKDRNVHKIHTGFNGPATGSKYEAFKKEFEESIALLSQ